MRSTFLAQAQNALIFLQFSKVISVLAEHAKTIFFVISKLVIQVELKASGRNFEQSIAWHCRTMQKYAGQDRV
jgi:hypothetical protein